MLLIFLRFRPIGLLTLLMASFSLWAQTDSTTIYLIGDTGNPKEAAEVFNLLEDKLSKTAPDAGAVVFLGDNLYPAGLPPANHFLRKEAEQALDLQLKHLANWQGPAIFVAGNHDWQYWGAEGWLYILNQEEYIKQEKPLRAVLPSGGCPGPSVLKIGEDVVLLMLDTQWWLHNFTKPNDSLCPAGTKQKWLLAISDSLKVYENKQVIVTAHHPLYSYGHHGGYFTWKQHLFPLLDFRKELYIPLPVLGTLSIWGRKLFPHPQDIRHKEYQTMKNGLAVILNQHPNVIYTSGHEHTLQHIKRGNVDYVVSGSGSKRNPIRKSKKALFTKSQMGFASVTYHKDGRKTLRFWVPESKQPIYRIAL